MEDLYAIKFTRPGLDYVRQVLGGRPHDEVRPLIDNIELQKREQDEAEPAPMPEEVAAAAMEPTPRVRRGRPPIQREEPTNGAGANGAA